MSVLALRDAGICIDGHWLVRNATVEVRPGNLTVFVGPNGSGKSTLLRLLCGLWEPTEGSAELEGKGLRRWRAREIAKRIAFVQQSSQLHYAFTVREVVAMGRYPHERRLRKPNPADAVSVEEAMDRTDVSALAERCVNQLSGGELQRVLLARCLATEADHILLDEPTSNLDLAHALDVLALCRDLARAGRAIAMAIHDLGAALRHADQAIVLSQGTVTATGAVSEVLTPGRIEDVFQVSAEPVESGSGSRGFLFRRGGTRSAGTEGDNQ